MSENFKEKFAGTELESYASRLDAIVEMIQDGDVSKEEGAELIEDIKREIEIDEMVGMMQIKSDILKAADLLMKVI
jgi:polyhydroxyalkanoate synthesis regulator phasin